MKIKIVKKEPASVCPGVRVVNDDGYVWEVEYPARDLRAGKKYVASIADKRLSHFMSFESVGYHSVWADTISELIKDIKSLNVPYYSSPEFLEKIRESDRKDTRTDRQVELYWDGRGTKITRGEVTLLNMTEYTSF